MDTLTVPCPAKINLLLSVGPRDARGYHPIRTVFQAVSLFDEIAISRDSVDSFECNLVLPERNTVRRAWSLLSEYRTLPPLRVMLTKRIPSEAGLGGGSSDAAGFIRGVIALTDIRLEKTELRDLAIAIGADVPFFLLGGRAMGEGYGEKLTPLPDPAKTWAVLIKPAIGCSTAQMYEALDRKTYEWRTVSLGESYNDFERVAPCECLELIERLKALGTCQAALTGSGSAVYGICRDFEHAETISRSVHVEGYEQAFVVKFLSKRESTVIL